MTESFYVDGEAVTFVNEDTPDLVMARVLALQEEEIRCWTSNSPQSTEENPLLMLVVKMKEKEQALEIISRVTEVPEELAAAMEVDASTCPACGAPLEGDPDRCPDCELSLK